MTKEEIEKEAREFASIILCIPAKDILPDDTIIAGYIAGRTKGEEKNELYKEKLKRHLKSTIKHVENFPDISYQSLAYKSILEVIESKIYE